jgi:hypothetical protein
VVLNDGHSWQELRNILLKTYESREDELRSSFDKLKSKPKPDRRSQIKNARESIKSLETEIDIESTFLELYKSMRKTHLGFLRFLENEKERHDQ